MSAPSPEELNEADRWLREAKEELAVAAHVHSDSQLPSRVVCFHAHLAAEKALKALQIRRGVLVRKIHNLAQLVRELPEEDRGRFDSSDLDLLNPWTVDGRYPADHEDVSREVAASVLEAANRVVALSSDCRPRASQEGLDE